MKLFKSEEAKADFKEKLRAGVIVGAIFLAITLFGSSVKVPGFAVPVGTIGMGVFGYFTSKGQLKKTRLTTAVIWAALTAIFTTAAVLAS